MRRFVAMVIVPIMSAGLFGGVAAANGGPPLTDGWFVDEGACPFEGCTYRGWTVDVATVLFDRPHGTRQVGIAVKGGAVRGETGIVYTRPIPVTVVAATRLEAYNYTDGKTYVRDLQPGERLHLVTYEGEGFNIAWLDGRRLSISIVQMHDRSVDRFKSCNIPSEKCWWTIPEDRRERETEWWARIRLPDGTVGWTTEVDNFFGVSAFD